jgi:hypothetical protein
MSSSVNSVFPFVSLCTPTFNRRHFFPILFEMFKLQTYPKNRMEWIIIDDGTDKVEDIINASNIKQICYYSLPTKLTLGAKRNLMHTYCKGSIIIYVDDDDYFPPERVSHSVSVLLNAPKGELIAGSSEIYLYFKDNGLYQFGPYGPNHATAGTFAFKRELLQYTKYDDKSCVGEESAFLKGYTIPLIQLDPVKTILVFPHEHNSFDKRTLLHNINGGPIRPAVNKTIDDFIKGVNASFIKNFFIDKMHELLLYYTPGEPTMKPDVLLQTEQIHKRRELLEQQIIKEQIMKESQQQQQNAVMVRFPNGETQYLTVEQLCQRIMELEQQLHQEKEKGYKMKEQVMLQQSDGTTIPLTVQQMCEIITQQQKRIMELSTKYE